MIIYIKIIIFLIFYSTVLIFTELVKRRYNIDSELTRKFDHIFVGLITILLTQFATRFEYLVTTSIFLIIFIYNRKKKYLKSLHCKNRKTFGEITYILGLLSLGYFLFDNRSAFIIGLLILSIPDSIAGLALYYSRKNNKNFTSFSIYFFSTIVIMLSLESLPIAFIIALTLSLVELTSPWGFDNFTVPIVYIIMISVLF